MGELNINYVLVSGPPCGRLKEFNKHLKDLVDGHKNDFDHSPHLWIGKYNERKVIVADLDAYVHDLMVSDSTDGGAYIDLFKDFTASAIKKSWDEAAQEMVQEIETAIDFSYDGIQDVVVFAHAVFFGSKFPRFFSCLDVDKLVLFGDPSNEIQSVQPQSFITIIDDVYSQVESLESSGFFKYSSENPNDYSQAVMIFYKSMKSLGINSDIMSTIQKNDKIGHLVSDMFSLYKTDFCLKWRTLESLTVEKCARNTHSHFDRDLSHARFVLFGRKQSFHSFVSLVLESDITDVGYLSHAITAGRNAHNEDPQSVDSELWWNTLAYQLASIGDSLQENNKIKNNNSNTQIYEKISEILIKQRRKIVSDAISTRNKILIFPTAIDELRFDDTLFPNSHQKKGFAIKNCLTDRWPKASLKGMKHVHPDDSDEHLTLFDPSNLISFRTNIISEIALRDHCLVENSDFMVVFRPRIAGGLSSGVEGELQHWGLKDGATVAILIYFLSDMKKWEENFKEKAIPLMKEDPKHNILTSQDSDYECKFRDTFFIQTANGATMSDDLRIGLIVDDVNEDGNTINFDSGDEEELFSKLALSISLLSELKDSKRFRREILVLRKNQKKNPDKVTVDLGDFWELVPFSYGDRKSNLEKSEKNKYMSFQILLN